MHVLIALLATAIGWIIKRFWPALVALTAAGVAYETEYLKDFFYWLFFESIKIINVLLGYVAGDLDIGEHISNLPVESLAFLSILRVPEAIAIVLGGVALRIVRKSILRW